MKNWKNALVLGLCAALSITLLAACSGGSSATTPAPSESLPAESVAPTDSAAPADFTTVVSGELHMATNAQFPPYEMVSDNGDGYEGIDVDIATKIAEKLGLKLVVDDMDFNSVITAVQTGKSDIAMAGLTVNEDRKQNVNFTDSYATGVQVVIVKEDSPITTVDDLFADGATYVAGTQDATTGYIYASDDLGEDRVVAYNNGATAVQALVSGSVDCVIIDNEPAKAFVAANPGLKILDTDYVTEDYAIGVSKENDALLNAVNDALKELIADGTVQSIVDTYITAS